MVTGPQRPIPLPQKVIALEQVLIVNRSTVLTDARLQNVMPAYQAFVTKDLGPIWNVAAELVFVGKGDAIPDGGWPLLHEDTTDQPGAGGYHLDDKGRVFGRVFVRDAMQAGEAWTIDGSHELAEMLVDPTAGTDDKVLVELRGQWARYQCLPEVCDACEGDMFGYHRPGADGTPVPLSDFVLPEYFYMHPANGVAYDFRGHLFSPAPSLLPDGYLGLRDRMTGEWSQVSNFRLGERRSRRPERMGRTRFAASRR